jgi:PHD/YefM family antitoxin component YafN of YafNO toxin-antitoxin module
VAVIMSPDDLASLEETLELLSTPGALEEIREARAKLDEGRFVSAETLKAKYLGR